MRHLLAAALAVSGALALPASATTGCLLFADGSGKPLSAQGDCASQLTPASTFKIPLALMGGLVLTRLLIDNISIATVVGFIAVGGVAARNGQPTGWNWRVFPVLLRACRANSYSANGKAPT